MCVFYVLYVVSIDMLVISVVYTHLLITQNVLNLFLRMIIFIILSLCSVPGWAEYVCVYYVCVCVMCVRILVITALFSSIYTVMISVYNPEISTITAATGFFLGELVYSFVLSAN